jgi:hypothetical protein
MYKFTHKEIVIDKKRLTCEIPSDFHTRLKYIALKYNISVAKLVNRWIYEKIQKEDEIDYGRKEDRDGYGQV